jgi:hypothetical protein
LTYLFVIDVISKVKSLRSVGSTMRVGLYQLVSVLGDERPRLDSGRVEEIRYRRHVSHLQ